jgi:hypothetical protein
MLTKAFKFKPNKSIWVKKMQENNYNKIDHFKCLITYTHTLMLSNLMVDGDENAKTQTQMTKVMRM